MNPDENLHESQGQNIPDEPSQSGNQEGGEESLPSARFFPAKDLARTASAGQQAQPPSAQPAEPRIEGADELKKKLADAEKQLAQEKEKVLMADIKAKQEEAFAAKVEASLKDIQQRIQRDRREREIEEERSELKDKLRELEGRLISERETWVQIMMSQMQPPPPQPPAQAAPGPDIDAKLEAMERRLAQSYGSIQKEAAGREAVPDAVRRMEDKIFQLEDALKKSANDKDLLAGEITKIRQSLPGLEKQGMYLDQISSVVLSLKKASEEMSARNQAPAQPAPAPHIPAAPQMPPQERFIPSAPGAEFAAGHVSEDKMRAISSLIKFQKTLTKLKAVNTALEREFNRVQAEKMQALGKSAMYQKELAEYEKNVRELESLLKTQSGRYAKQLEELEALQKASEEKIARAQEEKADVEDRYGHKLRQLESAKAELETRYKALEKDFSRAKDEKVQALNESAARAQDVIKVRREMSANEDAYRAQISELRKKWEEKSSRAENLDKELKRIQAEHKTKIGEMENMLASQSDKYARQLEGLESQQKAGEEKLQSLETEKAGLETQYKAMSAQKDSLASEKESLAAQMRKLQAEKAALALNIFKLNQQMQALSKQKAGLDQTLKYFQAKVSESSSVIEDFHARIAVLREKNIRLESELSRAAREQSELKDLLAREMALSADLKRTVEHYENTAKNFLMRLKWAMSGKMPHK